MLKPNFLNVLLIHELHGLYDAEKLLWKTLPRLLQGTKSGTVRAAFSQRLREAQFRMKPLEDVLRSLGAVPGSRICRSMNEIVARGENLLRQEESGAERDARLALVVREMAQHETAGYGLAQQYAELLGHGDIARILARLRTGELPVETEAEEQDTATDLFPAGAAYANYAGLPDRVPFQLATL